MPQLPLPLKSVMVSGRRSGWRPRSLRTCGVRSAISIASRALTGGRYRWTLGRDQTSVPAERGRAWRGGPCRGRRGEECGNAQARLAGDEAASTHGTSSEGLIGPARRRLEEPQRRPSRPVGERSSARPYKGERPAFARRPWGGEIPMWICARKSFWRSTRGGSCSAWSSPSSPGGSPRPRRRGPRPAPARARRRSSKLTAASRKPEIEARVRRDPQPADPGRPAPRSWLSAVPITSTPSTTEATSAAALNPNANGATINTGARIVSSTAWT